MTGKIIFTDFDGTLFDPDIGLFKAPFYNRQSAALIKSRNIKLVVTTGRHTWDLPTRIQYKLTAMPTPDVIIVGGGTRIYWRDQGRTYNRDLQWDHIVAQNWDKSIVRESVVPLIQKYNLHEYPSPNTHMLIITVYGRSLAEADEIESAINRHLKKAHLHSTATLSEQLFFPNNEDVYNGYIIVIPDSAGKDNSAQHVIDQYATKSHAKLDVYAYGDASIDIPMLCMKPSGVGEFKSYGLHMTPLARKYVAALSESSTRGVTIPTMLEGSSPASILMTLQHITSSPRNSPYRRIISPLESVIDRLVHPTLTPNEISIKGLQNVQDGLKKIYIQQPQHTSPHVFSRIGGLMLVIAGHLLDMVDGIRARLHPEQSTDDGQLVDVYADRMKEFLQLYNRHEYTAALTCILPSIARAQAECIGVVVPELDASGGSALTRSTGLITSLVYDIAGLHKRRSNNDNRIREANLATFTTRREAAREFSWAASRLATYDRTALTRLLFLVELLHTQYEQVRPHARIKLHALNEYMGLDVHKLRHTLRIPTLEISTTF